MHVIRHASHLLRGKVRCLVVPKQDFEYCRGRTTPPYFALQCRGQRRRLGPCHPDSLPACLPAGSSIQVMVATQTNWPNSDFALLASLVSRISPWMEDLGGGRFIPYSGAKIERERDRERHKVHSWCCRDYYGRRFQSQSVVETPIPHYYWIRLQTCCGMVVRG
jgi:hypothetical protein